MARANTYIDEERVDYFVDEWLKKLSDKEAREKVVDEASAKEFIMTTFSKDTGLSEFAKNENNTISPFKEIIKSDYIQDLITSNLRRNIGVSGDELEKRVRLLQKKRIILEEAFPKRRGVSRRKVIDIVMTNRVLNNYGFKKTINKKGISQYRNSTNGRFVSGKVLLGVADKVIIASATKRKEVEKLLRKDYKEKN